MKKASSVLDHDQVKEAVDMEWELLRQEESKKEYYDHLTAALEAYDVDESAFQEMTYSFGYDFYNTKLAKTSFMKSSAYQEDSERSDDEQFRDFLDQLVGKAKVKYYETAK